MNANILCKKVSVAVIIINSLVFTWAFSDEGQPGLTRHATTTKASIQGEARVREIRGGVEYAYDSTGWKALTPGKMLKPGATIRTTSHGEAVLTVAENTAMLKVNPNTSLELTPAPPPEELATAHPPHAKPPVEDERYAVVRSARGKAEVYTKHTEWQPIKVNATLGRGAMIRTDSKAVVDLFFPDSALVVRMKPDTVVRLEHHGFAWDENSALVESLLVVLDGGVITNARQNSKTGHYEMKSARVLYRVSEAAGQKRPPIP